MDKYEEDWIGQIDSDAQSALELAERAVRALRAYMEFPASPYASKEKALRILDGLE